MKSDKSLHFIGKYYSLMFAIAFLVFAIERFEDSENNLSLAGALTLCIAAGFALLSFFSTYGKFKLVELNDKGVSFISKDNTPAIPWENVQSIRRFFSTTGPLYKIKVANSNDFILFGTSLKFWNIGNENVSVHEINKYIALKRGKTEFVEEF